MHALDHMRIQIKFFIQNRTECMYDLFDLKKHTEKDVYI